MYGAYFNRELMWIQFDRRVLEEAMEPSTPLFERLKFFSIFTSNLDEFYMVRVGSLLNRMFLCPDYRENKTYMNSGEQIDAINGEVAKLYPLRDSVYSEIMSGFKGRALYHCQFKDLDGQQKHKVRDYLTREINPLLSPQIIDSKHPFPHLENKALYVAVKLRVKNNSTFGVIPIPSGMERVFPVPGTDKFLLIEDIILKYCDRAFDGYKIEDKTVIRVTRNTDIDISDEFCGGEDYRNFIKEKLRRRGKLAPVRLESSTSPDCVIPSFFAARLGLSEKSCFKCDSPLDTGFTWELEKLLRKPEFFYTPFRPQYSRIHRRVMDEAARRDILIAYPYESMKPLLELVHEAAEDESVLSIKIALYRIGAHSQITQNLCAAAENGKDVTVMIELGARFDETNNIYWAELMEEAGCHVIYGMKNLKVHGKIMLITIKTDGHISYLTHIGTGNYNEHTAKMYCDLNLITADEEMGKDASDFFHSLTISNPKVLYRRLLVAPYGLKNGIIRLIREQRENVSQGVPAHITAKMNSLTDKDIIDELAAASKAGVKIDLIIRGICCIRPGIPGITDNITVRSIVGRFLEHSRVYCFGTGDSVKVYISSADMMTRNTERRVEIAAPVLDREIAGEICSMLGAMLRDNVKARILGSDGTYSRVEIAGKRFDCQKYFLSLARERARIYSGKTAYKLNSSRPRKKPPFLFGRRL